MGLRYEGRSVPLRKEEELKPRLTHCPDHHLFALSQGPCKVAETLKPENHTLCPHQEACKSPG